MTTLDNLARAGSEAERAGLAHARAVADAVLYEGYLLYPYRASSSKNQVRWQFGVVGPAGAAEGGIGEAAHIAADCLVRAPASTELTVDVRFLQVQRRTVEAVDGGSFRAVDGLETPVGRVVPWDEAVECDHRLGPFTLAELASLAAARGAPPEYAVGAHAARELEHVHGGGGALVGRLVRDRAELSGLLAVGAEVTDGLTLLRLRLTNTAPEQADAVSAVARSFLGVHLILQLSQGAFVSTVDPPPDATAAAAGCAHDRWWPVLAGPPDEDRVLLVSPIIVEDHAELAPESPGALFDSTEIDEILTLRILTMTDDEKAEARATDQRAAAIIDRSESITTDELARLHGTLRRPNGLDPAIEDLTWTTPTDLGPDPDGAPVLETTAPWWDPESDATVSPATDTVVVAGVRISRGSQVVVRPNRRADAQDLFVVGRTATVAAVLSDVDGDTHVAVTIDDDPGADLHDWYGRYLYFAPDELVPVPSGEGTLEVSERVVTPEGDSP